MLISQYNLYLGSSEVLALVNDIINYYDKTASMRACIRTQTGRNTNAVGM